MNPEQKAQLEADGYYVTTAAEWLGLTQAESDEVEIRIVLAKFLRFARERAGLSMRAAGRRLGITGAQYRRLETGVGENDIERRIVAALTFGARYQAIGRAIAEWPGDTSLNDREPEPASEAPEARPPARVRARAV